MPVESKTKPISWADQVEEGENEVTKKPERVERPSAGKPALPVATSVKDKNLKIVTEFKVIDDKKVKIIRKYRTETHLVSKSIAQRKTWKKFGEAMRDPPGPNPANTIVAEDVFLQFLSSKDMAEEAKQNEEGLLKNAKNVKCRLCKEDHWTVHCPYKNTLEPMQETLKGDDRKSGSSAALPGVEEKLKSGKYVPPNMREGGNRRGESMQSSSRDESATIRVTNLSEDVRETDLQELFKPFGSIQRYYLAMDKMTQQSKGFAFVTFHRKEDAAKAIKCVSGYGYDHLILNVEWAKPPSQQ